MPIHKKSWLPMALLGMLGIAVASAPVQAQFGPGDPPRKKDGDGPGIRVRPSLPPNGDKDRLRDPRRVAPYELIDAPRVPALGDAQRGRLNNVRDPYATAPPDYQPNSGYPIGGGYGFNYYIPDPYESYLNGLSNVIRAQGQYGLDYNEARLLNQQAIQAKYETRRKMIEYELYRRSLIPTANERREKEFREEVQLARNNPPLTKILDASSMNVLLKSINKLQRDGLRAPTILVDPKSLSHVNVTTGSAGNVGLLRDDGKLTWPVALMEQDFTEARESVDRLAKDIVVDARNNGSVDRKMLRDLQLWWGILDEKLDKSVRAMPPSQYITARRYLNVLRSAVKGLEDPMAAKYFRKEFAATGRTISEVVANMSDQGLSFAPAAPGDESYYRAVHELLVKLEAALTAESARQ